MNELPSLIPHALPAQSAKEDPMHSAARILAVSLMVIVACDWPLSSDAGYLSASLTEAEEGLDPAIDNYEGSGDFNDRSRFNLSSRGIGASEGDAFHLTGFDVRRPAPGAYPLRQWKGINDDQESGFIAQFTRTLPDGGREHFMAESGHIVISRSGRRSVEGRFEFTGFRWCHYPHGVGDSADWEGYCDTFLPAVLPADIPRIFVAGSFKAVKRELGVSVGTPYNP